MEEKENMSNGDKILTEEELKEFQKQLDAALIKSNDLVKNFQIYIGLYTSSGKMQKNQTSHLTKEDFEKLQQPVNYIHVESFKKFCENIEEDKTYITHKALLLNEDNFAMAFHPMIWKVLKYEEKIAAMRIAWQKTNGTEPKEFCNYLSTTVSFVGKDYQGSLNIGSVITFTQDNLCWNLLKMIAYAKHSVKFNYYFNKIMSKPHNRITDFDSFEELQYSELDGNIIGDDDRIDLKQEALRLNSIDNRKRRSDFLNADYLLLDHSEELKGLYPDFDKAVEDEIDKLNQENQFIAEELGYNQKNIDELFLNLKVDEYNKEYTDKYNQLHNDYAQLDVNINVLKKPALNATKDLRQKRDNLKALLQTTNDEKKINALNDGISKLNKKIDKIHDKYLKNSKELMLEFVKEQKEISKQIEELRSHMVTVEEAKQHFKEHFYPEKTNIKKVENSQISKDENEKLD